MWPEGVPTAASVQEILFFQSQTMEMMYKIIADELKAMDIKDLHPEDYLNFFVLEIGKNRHLTAALTQINLQTKVQRPRLQKSADDEYVILGSANINQRSLAGTRDTEIAMGAYQPHHAWSTENQHPHGQVYGWRSTSEWLMIVSMILQVWIV